MQPEAAKLTSQSTTSSSAVCSLRPHNSTVIPTQHFPTMSSAFWTTGCLYGASAVMLGAFGAHGLKSRISDPSRLANWSTAAQYQVSIAHPPIPLRTRRTGCTNSKSGQLMHSLALLLAEQAAPKNIWAKSLFTAGYVSFVVPWEWQRRLTERIG